MSLKISRTPFRISFFGGGTDYPDWYLAEGGAVLSTTINKYCYITARYFPEFFPVTHRIVWSHIEIVNSFAEILHPAVREGLYMEGFDETQGIEIHHQGDLPARSGMGSSSAFAVGLFQVLGALQGQYLTKEQLYTKALDLEQNRLKDAVGSQDQVAVAIGGFNTIEFAQNGTITTTPVAAPQERLEQLESKLMLFYTGTCRLSKTITSKVIANLKQRSAILREMQAQVYTARDILIDGDLDEFGRMLDHGWKLKQSLATEIANNTITDIYTQATRAGAIGGKLLGGGGSGFMLFYVPEDSQDAVRQILSHLLHVPFKFDTQGSVLVSNGSP